MSAQCPTGETRECAVPEPGCGDHGVCSPCTGQCVCADGWSGTHCSVPPPSNVPCTRSDADFHKAHNNGDLSCGNFGSYGVCDVASGRCMCTNGNYGTRCQDECQTDSHCGGPGMVTRTGTSQAIGTCDAMNRCKCANGWSGKQCRVAPAGGKCKVDADCGWGGKVNGRCVDGKCVCNADSDGKPGYTGVFCEKVFEEQDIPCKTSANCPPKSKCDPNTNTCYNPSSSPNWIIDTVEQLAEGFFTPENALFMATDKILFEKVGARALKYVIAKGLESRVAQAATERVTAGTLASLTKYLPEAMAARVATSVAARDAMEQTVALAAKEVAKEMVGFAVDTLNVLQMFGMVLDVMDVRGLQTQMTQDAINYLERGMYTHVNTMPVAAEAKIQLPEPVFPETTVEFKRHLRSKKMVDQVTSDMAEYLSLLKVNSNGQAILPLFVSLADLRADAAREKYKVYWSMSGHNDVVFNRLVSYGWVMWVLGALLVISIVLTCVFSSAAVQARLKKA